MKTVKKQEGFIREIVVALIVIFTLAHFNLDANEIWDYIVTTYKSVIN
jgi:hypothetical protein